MEPEHPTITKHRQRMAKRVDVDERRYYKQLAKEYFNPNVN